MNAAVEADDELAEIARRLQAGPEEFLTLRLLSPAEESLVRQDSEPSEGEPMQPKNVLNGLKRLAADVFGRGPQPMSAEEDLKVLRVQEFLTARKSLSRTSPP